MTGPRPIFPTSEPLAPEKTYISGFPSTGPDVGRLEQSVRLGTQTKPDSAARILSLQYKTGLPPDLIARNLDTIEAETKRQGFNAEAFRQTNPAVAAWMAQHPTNAALAEDDLDQLGGIEQTLKLLVKAGISRDPVAAAAFARTRPIRAITRGFQIGRAQDEQGLLDYDRMLANGRSDPATTARLATLEAELQHEPTGGNALDKTLVSAAKIVGQMTSAGAEVAEKATLGFAAGAAVGALGGPLAPITSTVGAVTGATVGAAVGTFQHTMRVEAGSAYRALEQVRGANGETIGEDAKRNAALGIGAINGLLEAGGLEIAAMPFRAGIKAFARESARDALARPTMRTVLGKVGATYALAQAGEVGEEVAQEITSVIGEEIAKAASNGQFATVMRDPEQREMFWDRIAGVATETARGMLLLGLPGASVHLAGEVVSARQATRREAGYLALFKQVAESKTLDRHAPAVEAIVGEATKGTPMESVLIDVAPLQEYFQSRGEDPREEVRQLWGSTEEYDAAVQSNGQLSIPIARLATVAARTEHGPFFASEIRRTPDEQNAREAKVAIEQAQERAKAEAPTQSDRRDEIQAQLEAQISATGRYRPQDVAPMAQQMADFFATQGVRATRDPKALLERYRLFIGRGDAAVSEAQQVEFEQALAQSVPAADVEQMLALMGESGFAFGGDGATVIVPAGQKIAGADDTVTMMRTAMGYVGKDEFRARASGEIDRRGAKGNAVAEQAAVEETARAIVGEGRTRGDLHQAARARLRIGPDRQLTVDIFETADLSSFLHESGHVYLEIMRDLAGETEQHAADWATILKTLKVTSGDQITREHHEQFARMTEQYFRTGEAPSIALRRAFYRFSLWLKTLYRQAEALNASISPEMRDVFDRMFATDAEIEAAENEAAVMPLFTDAKSAGMSDEMFAAYRATVEDAHIQSVDRLRAKLMHEKLRETQAWWKEEKAQVRAQVEQEIHAEPVYQALSALQRGTLPDGTPLEEPVKLSKDDLVERYGAEFLKTLPRPYVYTREGGVSAEVVAERFGFTSGDEMLRAIAKAPKMAAAIEVETNERMSARQGDLRLDGTIAEEAEEAVLTEHREKVLRDELRALHALHRAVKPFTDAAKAEQKRTATVGRAILAGIPSEQVVTEIAQARIGALRVRDIKPFTFWVAARKASRAAMTALGKQDYVEAANAKQAELLNLALYREARRTLERTDAIQRFARKLQQPAAQARLGKAGGGYLDQVMKILERFDFAPMTLSAIDRRASMASFIKSQEEKGLPVNIPEDMQNEAFRMPWKEMTPADLEGVHDVLRHIDHLSRLKNRMMKDAAQRSLDEAIALAVSSIEANAKRTIPTDAEPNLPGSRAAQMAGMFFAAHRKLGSLVREMDGFQDNGAMWSLAMRPLNDAADAHAVLKKEMTEKLDAIFQAAYSKEDMVAMYRKHLEGVLNASVSKMAKVMMLLNWGAEDNRAKLLAGLSISFGREVTATHVEALIDTLEKKDLDFAQAIWDLYDHYRPQFFGLVERMDGIPPEKVEAAPFVTRFGEYRGGYHPMAYDPTQSNTAYKNIEATLASQSARGAAVRASTKSGSRKARVDGVRLPLRLDFGVIFGHLEEIALDITHTEALIDVSRVIGSDEVANTVRRHYGDVVYDQLRASLKDIAGGDQAARHALDGSISWLRSGASIAGLGWNISTSLLQPLGLLPAMVRVGPKWVGRGLARWLGSAKGMENSVAWIHSVSPFMANRGTTQMREINEIRNKIGMTRGRAGLFTDAWIAKATGQRLDLADVEDSFFYLIGKAQMVADVPTWLGGYEKAMASGVDEQTAIALADQGVLDSQGGGQMKDLARVERGGALLKLWTNFYSYQNTLYQLNVEAVKKTEFTNLRSVGRLAVDMLLLNVIPTTLGVMLRSALRGDDPTDDEAFTGKMVRENLSFLLGQFVFVRELSAFVQGFHGYEGPAGARVFSEAGKVMQQAGQGELDAAFFRALNGLSGVLFHYPAGQVERSSRETKALIDGRSVNPLAPIFGPPPNR
jgi:hypothetical protein